MAPMYETEVSVILPCRNEAGAIRKCIREIKSALAAEKVSGEIIVIDHSDDKSAEIAAEEGAQVLRIPKEGYGSACILGVKEARGRYIITGDADGSYDFTEIGRLLAALRKNCDIVVGSRMRGEIKKGAMPFSHRYIGTPLLNWAMARLFGLKVTDSQSGFRAIKKSALQKLDLVAGGFEFCSELLVKAKARGMKIREVPISYRKRIGQSKLHTFRDGWRHLRFMLLLAPTHLFLIPGLLLSLFGWWLLAALIQGPTQLFGLNFNIHPMIFGGMLAIAGFQTIVFGLFTKTYAVVTRFEDRNVVVSFLARHFTLERAAVFGSLVLGVGLLLGLRILYKWLSSGLGEIVAIRSGILGLTLAVVGLQIIFSAFFLSILGIEKTKEFAQ